MTDHEWLVTAVCAGCLKSPAGQAILNGAVAIATLRKDTQPERCILCGFALETSTTKHP